MNEAESRALYASDAEFQQAVGSLIQQYRQAANVSQEVVARAAGVSRLTVLRWEQAKREISLRQWTMVAELLAIPVVAWPRRFAMAVV